MKTSKCGARVLAYLPEGSAHPAGHLDRLVENHVVVGRHGEVDAGHAVEERLGGDPQQMQIADLTKTR